MEHQRRTSALKKAGSLPGVPVPPLSRACCSLFLRLSALRRRSRQALSAALEAKQTAEPGTLLLSPARKKESFAANPGEGFFFYPFFSPRSRVSIRMGVAVRPNVSRIWFSRYR